ncbi:MAG: hypothetical protein J3Q66DRAFT_332369, partial [Benniella sp.]
MMVLVASSTHMRLLLLSPSASLFRIAGPEQSLLEARLQVSFELCTQDKIMSPLLFHSHVPYVHCLSRSTRTLSLTHRHL